MRVSFTSEGGQSAKLEKAKKQVGDTNITPPNISTLDNSKKTDDKATASSSSSKDKKMWYTRVVGSKVSRKALANKSNLMDQSISDLGNREKDTAMVLSKYQTLSIMLENSLEVSRIKKGQKSLKMGICMLDNTKKVNFKPNTTFHGSNKDIIKAPPPKTPQGNIPMKYSSNQAVSEEDEDVLI